MVEKSKKKVEYKFDIFALLTKINNKDYKYLDSLTDEDKKHINPYMIMRWMSGSNDPRHIIFLNALVNPFVWGIPSDHAKEDHFNLKMRLLAICGTKQNTRFTWVKTKSDKKQPLSIKIVQEYFDYNSRDAEHALTLLNSSDIIDYAEQLGYQRDQINKIKKEFS